MKKLKIFAFEECDDGLYRDGSLISYEERVFVVASNKETAEKLFHKSYENCSVGPYEVESEEEADLLGFHYDELKTGLYY